MKLVGKRIYYDNGTGSTIITTPEIKGTKIIVATVEQDITTYKELSERNRDSFDYIELEYGQYAQDFSESNGYRVNPKTKELEFSYPDPNEPEAPQVFVKPLTEQIKEAQEYSQMVSDDLQAFMDFYFENGGM